MYANFDLARGRIGAVGSDVTAVILRGSPFLGKGWWFIAITGTTNAATTNANGTMVGFCQDNINATKQPGYTGSAEENFYLWHVGLEQKATPSIILQNAEATVLSKTKPADALSVFVPTGCTSALFRFEDGSTQTVSGLTQNALNAVPTTLNRTFIVEITGLVSGAYFITADPGSYTFTGQPVAFQKVNLIVAGNNTYTFAGQAVALSVPNHILAALAGSYSFNGKDVALSKSTVNAYVLPALAGAYTFTGNAALLIKQRPPLIAGPGAYTFTGQPVAISKVRTVVAAKGSYTFTGMYAALTYTRFDRSTIPNIANAGINVRRAQVKPAIPDPVKEDDIMVATLKALKESVELMQGQRTVSQRPATVRWQDLIDLGIIDANKVPKP